MAAPPPAGCGQVGGAVVGPLSRVGVKDARERAVVVPPVGHREVAARAVGEAGLKAKPPLVEAPGIGVKAPRVAPREPDVKAGHKVAGVRHKRPRRPVAGRLKAVRKRAPVRHAPLKLQEPALAPPPVTPKAQGLKAKAHRRQVAGIAALIVDLLPVLVRRL